MSLSRIQSIDLDHAIMMMHWTSALIGLATATLVMAKVMQPLLVEKNRRPRWIGFEQLHFIGLSALLVLVSSAAGLIVLRLELSCASPLVSLRLGPVCLPRSMTVELMLYSGLIGSQLLFDAVMLPLLRRPRLVEAHTIQELVLASTVASGWLVGWLAITIVSIASLPVSWTPVALITSVALAWLLLSSVGVGVLVKHVAAVRGRLTGDSAVVQSRSMQFEPMPANSGAASLPRLQIEPQRPQLQEAPSIRSPAVLEANNLEDTPQKMVTVRRIEATGPKVSPALAVARVARSALVGTFLISFVINALMLTGPLYMLQVYDRVLTSRSSETLVVLTTLVVGLYIVMGILDFIQSRILSRLAIRLDSVLARPLLEIAVCAVPQGERGASPMRDLEQIRQLISGPAVPALLDLPWAPLYFVLVFALHPILGLLALTGAIVLVVLSVLNQTMTRKPLAQSAEIMTSCDGMVEAGWRGADTLRALGMTGSFSSRWLTKHAEALTSQLRAGDTAGTIATATRVARMLLQSLLLGAGAWLSLHDAVSVVP